MKTKHLIYLLNLIFLTTNANAQLKVFSGGAITIGNTTAPASGFKLHVQGNSLFSSNSFSGSSAAFIRGLNGNSTDTTPDYTWWGDDRTGFFHPSDNVIGFTIRGLEKSRINSLGHLLLNTTYENNFRLSVFCDRDEAAFGTSTNHTSNYEYAHGSYVNREYTKNWVVIFNEKENFFVYGNGDVWSNTNYFYSDSTLKENVQPIQDAKNKILSLRGVKYNFKTAILSNPNDTTTFISGIQPSTQIGMIAQEVERVVPEAVSTNDHNIKGIAYQNLIALLIEGFKQQDSELVDLRNQIAVCCAGHLSGSLRKTVNANNSNPNLKDARLDQNNPNPFNLNTRISFFIPESSTSNSLMIFDMQGVLLKQYNLTCQGESSITIESNEFKPGIYLYSLIVDNTEIDTKRMIITQ